MPQSAAGDRSVRTGAGTAQKLHQLRDVSPAGVDVGVGSGAGVDASVFPAAHASSILMPQLAFPILCRTARGAHGAWQKFERGEMALFPFYDQFGRDLSDTKTNNPAYVKYCRRHALGAYDVTLAPAPSSSSSSLSPQLHQLTSCRTGGVPCAPLFLFCRLPIRVPDAARRDAAH